MTVTNDLELTISRVENGLTPPADSQQTPTCKSFSLQERMKYLNIPGVSIAVVNDGRLEWARGYGQLAMGENSPVNTDSLFHACSMSKLVTTIAVLKLVQNNVLTLDEDINLKLKEWKIPDNTLTQKHPVTLRHLLSHQGGIVDQDGSFGVYQAGAPFPLLHDILQGSSEYNTKPVQIEYLPASQFSYSDAGFCVIEQLIIDNTGKSLQEAVKELVFDPLEMKNSGFHTAIESTNNLHVAVGHNKQGNIVDERRPIYPYPAAAGVWSTPTDLSLLIIELHRSLEGAGKLQISSNLVQDMLTSQGVTDWAGLGAFLGGEGTQTRMMSLGWGVGFQCMLIAYPYLGAGAVVMMNSDPGCHQDKGLIGELIRCVEQEYNWKTP